jgi:hypothetical protein
LVVAAGDESPSSAVIGGGHVDYWDGTDIDIIRVQPTPSPRWPPTMPSSTDTGATSPR